MPSNVRRGLVEIARHREEALGAEEPAVGDLRQPARAQRARKLAAHRLQRVGMIDRHIALAAAGFVIARQRGDAFEQRRFAGAVFADDDGDGAVEIQLEIVAQERQAERIGRASAIRAGSSQMRLRYGAGRLIGRFCLEAMPSAPRAPRT